MRAAIVLSLFALAAARHNEVWTAEQEAAAGIVKNNYREAVQPYHLSKDDFAAKYGAVPDEFTWCNKDGVNYCTMSRNQHIPQYCGSCWAHGAVSALGDRIKIARKAQGIDINLSVQHILNCGEVGSCHGGSVAGPYQWLHSISKSGAGISYETSNPYFACSSESSEGFCSHVDTTCTALNIARTCPTFNEPCVGLSQYPNATISDYGSISGVDQMQAEIYARGPISCGIDAVPILDYQGGVATGPNGGVDHVISVVGWGKENGQSYWWVRNSWGEYWGLMGYVKVAFGSLSVEADCSWAVLDQFTSIEQGNEMHCDESGDNCDASKTYLRANM